MGIHTYMVVERTRSTSITLFDNALSVAGWEGVCLAWPYFLPLCLVRWPS